MASDDFCRPIRIAIGRLRGLAKIKLPILAWSFGRWLRCSLLTDPWAGYARRSRVVPLRSELRGTSPPPVSFPKPDERFAIRGASGQNPCAMIGNFILARPLSASADRGGRTYFLNAISFPGEKWFCLFGMGFSKGAGSQFGAGD